MQRTTLHLIAIGLGAALLAACGPSSGGAGAGGGPGNMPPPAVTVVTIEPQLVTLTTELPGRTSAFRVAEVRPQVNGVLQKRLFTEGADVREGQQLYQIDPSVYQAQLDTAQAQLAHAQAAVTSANLLAERDKPLVASNAVSKQDYDNAVASQLQAQADVATANAAIESARINLAYTKVLAPISGRTGRSITEGALVTANQATSLVTIQQLDPIYVDISQSVATLLRLERELAQGRLKTTGDNQAQVKLTLEDNSTYDQLGTLQFSEASVDQGTGSVILRAVFPNPKDLLLPGMFVRAELEEGVQDNALLIPQPAVTHDAKGQATAFVVTPDNKVELRNLQADRAVGDKWLVTGGISAGERVIVEGVQKVQPGMTVQPFEETNSPAAQPSQS
jgi:membrane fusion protein (multidrug efflux system)